MKDTTILWLLKKIDSGVTRRRDLLMAAEEEGVHPGTISTYLTGANLYGHVTPELSRTNKRGQTYKFNPRAARRPSYIQRTGHGEYELTDLGRGLIQRSKGLRMNPRTLQWETLRITRGQLKRIIREELMREMHEDEWDPGRQTRWSFQGPVPKDMPVSDEENWIARVGSGEIDSGRTPRYSRTGELQDVIDDTESYLDDIEYEAPGTTGAYMYGAEEMPYDPMCDIDDDECY